MDRAHLIGLGLLVTLALVPLAIGLVRTPVTSPTAELPTDSPPCTRERAEPAARCGVCHPEIYAQWRAGPHAAAFDDPLFRAEYEPAPSPFCTDCHAHGEARFGHDPHDGVDCSGCHPPAERPMISDGVSMCAGCHQFDFPEGSFAGRGHYDPADPLQDTVHEWMRSTAASRGQSCVDCHMPASGAAHEPRRHRMLDTHDPTLLTRALRVQGRAHHEPEGLVVDLSVAPGQVGHRVPTGDMFRRLRVRVEVEGEPAHERWLGRIFAQAIASDDRGFRLRPVLDERVPAPGEEPAAPLRFVLPTRDATRVRWSIDLYRMPPEHAHHRGLDEAAIRVPMVTGQLEVEPAPGPHPKVAM